METLPTARRLASRFVAGDTLGEAIAVARKLNAEGIAVTLDHLGESVTTIEEASRARDVYLEALDTIRDSGIQGNVSMKLTQLGLDIDSEACRVNLEQLVRRAAECKSFVRVDMESSQYTQRTLDLVTAMHRSYGAVGAVIQAYLFRSRADVENLCNRKIRVRLCKGAYLEPPTLAFTKKADVDRNFIDLMQRLLERGTYPALATHDEKMIEQTRTYAGKRGIPRDAFEFQMLYGIRRDLQEQLARDGYNMRVYVPYGKHWYPYFMRRLAERPANALFIAKNMLRK